MADVNISDATSSSSGVIPTTNATIPALVSAQSTTDIVSDKTIDLLKCPVCLEIAFNAFVGNCGHSVCGFCQQQIQPKLQTASPCPLCRKLTNFAPNYMLRGLLEQPMFAKSVQRCKNRGYPTMFHILHNDLDELHTATVLEWLVTAQKNGAFTFEDTDQFTTKYNVKMSYLFTKDIGAGYDINMFSQPSIVCKAYDRTYILFFDRKVFILT
jgi:hypothetical protein